MDIRPLRPGDRRGEFASGNPDLDRFFSKYAGHNQFVHHIGTTYVAVEGDLILGFVTVAPGQIEASEFPPSSITVRLPRYPVPILRLARMAVERSFQRRGVGSELVRFVFELALRIAQDYGCAGVVVDAKSEAVEFYRRFDFREVPTLSGQLRAGPMPTPMFVSILTLKDALGR